VQRRPRSTIAAVRKRIGIFQYEWPLQIHTTNLAIKLAESGFQVDVYLYQCNSAFINMSALTDHSGVNVYLFKRSFMERVVDRLVRDARRLLHLEYCHPDRIAQVARQHLEHVAGNGKYDYFIGIEKRGLVWAGMLAESLGTPYLYYSLELHTDEHLTLKGKPDFVAIRRLEKEYHGRAAGTIVQDEWRARVLLDSNDIGETDVIYLPVSVTGPRVEKKGRYLHEKLGIDFTKKIVLYFGQVCKGRGATELMECAQRFGDDLVLVLHGPILPDVPMGSDYGGNVFFSQEIIDSVDIPEMVSSAHIGIALYGDANINDRLTAFSSEKIAFYMQSGLPIIANTNESYELLMRHHRCGELVDRIDQVPEAAGRILADYEQYRAAAFAAYEHFYSFDTNVHQLIEYLSRDG
jgi:glycosyltransferase involved in cell wall biosynthesis